MRSIPMEVDGIDHVVLRVVSIERSLEFYVGILGLHVERIIEGAGLQQMRCGKNMIDLLAIPQGATLPGPGKGNVDHVCINVRGDIDDIVTYLGERNVRMRSAPGEAYGATGFGTSVYAFDPDGHQIEIKTNYAQYPMKSTLAEALASSTRPRAEA